MLMKNEYSTQSGFKRKIYCNYFQNCFCIIVYTRKECVAMRLVVTTTGKPLILDNNHFKFSVICIRFMYKYLALCYFFPFLIRRRLSFLKDISCLILFTCVHIKKATFEICSHMILPCHYRNGVYLV